MSGTVLIAVTHLLGIGHLVRARLLAGALAEAGFSVTLASGGMPDGKRAAAYRFVQLPPVKIEGVAFSALLDEMGAPVMPDLRASRIAALEALAGELRPDMLVTEHFPFGRRQLAGEFSALIAAVERARPSARILASIRDVLVRPVRPGRIEETHDRVARLYDGVLVHGDENLLPLETSWPVDAALRERLRYTGYLAPAVAPQARAGTGDEILVSGGGSAAALPLFEIALVAAALAPARRWRLLVGHGVPADTFERLRAGAPTNAVVERVRSDFPALLAGCAVSVSQAGYNTVIDLIQARRPAILVPFDAAAETEQAVRAEALRRGGLAEVLRLGATLTPQALAAAVDRQAGHMPPLLPAALDGAARSVAVIREILAFNP